MSVFPVMAPRPSPVTSFMGGGAKLRLIPADERRRFAHMFSQRFRVSLRSDRMGRRLEGATIADAPSGELISSAVPIGALAGQLAPGDWIEFEACSIETANAELRRREIALGAA